MKKLSSQLISILMGLFLVTGVTFAAGSKPRLVYVYSDGCRMCHQFEDVVLSDPEVQTALKHFDFSEINGSVTEVDAEVTPTVLIYNAKNKRTHKFVPVLNKGKFLEVLTKITASNTVNNTATNKTVADKAVANKAVVDQTTNTGTSTSTSTKSNAKVADKVNGENKATTKDNVSKDTVSKDNLNKDNVTKDNVDRVKSPEDKNKVIDSKEVNKTGELNKAKEANQTTEINKNLGEAGKLKDAKEINNNAEGVNKVVKETKEIKKPGGKLLN